MIVDCAHYRDGHRQRRGPMRPEEAAAIPALSGWGWSIEQAEQVVFSGAVAPVQRVYLLRREVSDFYRAVHPPTFIASFFGMNFEHMPELRWEGAYPLVIVLMIVAALALHRSFKRAGWI